MLWQPPLSRGTGTEQDVPPWFCLLLVSFVCSNVVRLRPNEPKRRELFVQARKHSFLCLAIIERQWLKQLLRSHGRGTCPKLTENDKKWCSIVCAIRYCHFLIELSQYCGNYQTCRLVLPSFGLTQKA